MVANAFEEKKWESSVTKFRSPRTAVEMYTVYDQTIWPCHLCTSMERRLSKVKVDGVVGPVKA